MNKYNKSAENLTIDFIKMHSIGNDFIVIEGNPDEIFAGKNKGVCIKYMAHRNFGIGCDQLIFWQRNKNNNIHLWIFNNDSSAAQMCGNGIKCVAGLNFSRQQNNHLNFTVEGSENIIEVTLSDSNQICVNMGSPVVISFLNEEKNTLENLVNLGNLHKVIPFPLPSLSDSSAIIASLISVMDAAANNSYNVNYIMADKKKNVLYIVTNERGCGLTLSCGSGITSSVFWCMQMGLFEESTSAIEVITPGIIERNELNNINCVKIINEKYWLCGDYENVFKATISLPQTIDVII